MLGRFIIMDLWGAVLTLLVVLMGSFVVNSGGGMDATYCLYYGLMCLVNGVFDIILFVERWIHVKYPLFAPNAPVMFNFASLVFLLCPLVEMACTVLAAYIYMDAQEQESRLMLPAYYPVTSGMREDLDAVANGRPIRVRPDAGGWQPFQGRCHHL